MPASRRPPVDPDAPIHDLIAQWTSYRSMIDWEDETTDVRYQGLLENFIVARGERAVSALEALCRGEELPRRRDAAQLLQRAQQSIEQDAAKRGSFRQLLDRALPKSTPRLPENWPRDRRRNTAIEQVFKLGDWLGEASFQSGAAGPVRHAPEQAHWAAGVAFPISAALEVGELLDGQGIHLDLEPLRAILAAPDSPAPARIQSVLADYNTRLGMYHPLYEAVYQLGWHLKVAKNAIRHAGALWNSGKEPEYAGSPEYTLAFEELKKTLPYTTALAEVGVTVSIDAISYTAALAAAGGVVSPDIISNIMQAISKNKEPILLIISFLEMQAAYLEKLAGIQQELPNINQEPIP